MHAPTLSPVMLYTAAADYLFRRMVDISSGNCRLHGLEEAESRWRIFRPHYSPGPELEGMIASWYDDLCLDRAERQAFSLHIFGSDHRWANPPV